MPSSRGVSPSLPFIAVTLLIVLGVAGLAGCGASDPLTEARTLQRTGDFAGSIEPLRELIAERPDDAEVLYLYGRALSITGQVSQAEWSLREAMADPEWVVPAAMQLAASALQVRNYSTAIEATERVLEAEPDNVSALMVRANAHASMQSRESWKQALVDIDRVLELDPENIDALRPRIQALLSLNRIDEAEQQLEELGERIQEGELGSDMEGWHCATLAVFAEESGDHELADQRFTECLERFPAHSNLISNALRFYDARGAQRRTLEILRAALEEAPHARDYRVGLAQRLRAAGRNEEAVELLREATESPNPLVAVGAWLALAEHYQAVRDFASGAEAADRAVALAEKAGISNPHLLLEHADALLLAGELERARAVADDMGLEAHRELVLARIAQERGRYAEALEHYQRAFQRWPNNAPARFEAARTAAAAGDFERAIEEYRYAIRVDPEATDARTELATLYLAEGRPRDALHMLRIRDSAPLSLEGELLSVRLWAQVGQEATAQRALARFHAGARHALPRALVSAAEGVRARSGAENAARLLREARGFDLTAPGNAEALRALVRLSHEAGELEEAEAIVQDALAAHPEAAVLHEIQGLALELRGAPAEEVRAAYARALELDPDDVRALAGLAREALARDPQEALALFERAVAADPSDPEARRGAARALVASEQLEEAQRRLEAHLALLPYDSEAAADLAALHLERGAATEETLALARRAVRFRGGARALDLLSRVHAQRGDTEQATRAAEAARRLREQPAADAS